MLARMVELTELEARLICLADVDGMSTIFAEREALIAALPAELPPGCEPLVERFLALAAANEHAATAAADVIRRELSKVIVRAQRRHGLRAVRAVRVDGPRGIAWRTASTSPASRPASTRRRSSRS